MEAQQNPGKQIIFLPLSRTQGRHHAGVYRQFIQTSAGCNYRESVRYLFQFLWQVQSLKPTQSN